MNAANCELAKGLVGATYISQVRSTPLVDKEEGHASPTSSRCALAKQMMSVRGCMTRQGQRPRAATASHVASQPSDAFPIVQGSEALTRRHNLVRTLLANRRLPTTGWDDATIEMFLQVRS
jgi:hypothetical protein